MPRPRKTRTHAAKRSRKVRRTRKQRGGSTARITRNVSAAFRESKANPIGNYFYVPKEEDFYKGNAMFIGQRFDYGIGEKNLTKKAAEVKRERKAAKYPYEECLFFFELQLPNAGAEKYPSLPPIVLHKTAGIINYRLHPNLYGYGRFTEGGIDEKTCLGILNTFGTAEWKGEMTIWSVLGAMQALFIENPGMLEPTWSHLRNTHPQGILYNQHVLYESIDITAKVYDMVVKSLTTSSTASNIKFNNAKVTENAIPPYVTPFLGTLATRAYSALTFLIGKLELFIEANDGKSVLDLPAYAHHHDAKRADFGKLLQRMKATRILIPSALKVNVFPSGEGETQHALYEESQPKWPNGKAMTFERLSWNLGTDFGEAVFDLSDVSEWLHDVMV